MFKKGRTLDLLWFSCSAWLCAWSREFPSCILALSRLNQARPTAQVSGLSPSCVRHLWEVSVARVLDRGGLARDLNEIGLWMSTGAKSWPEAREQETKAETQPSLGDARLGAAEASGCSYTSVPCVPQIVREDVEGLDSSAASTKLGLLPDSVEAGNHVWGIE